MQKVIIIAPFRSDRYVDDLKSQMEILGYWVAGPRELLTRRSIREDVRCVILNWFEDFTSNRIWKNRVKYIARRAFLAFLSHYKIEFVYVMHNRKPHENAAPREFMKMRRLLSDNSAAISVLCTESKKVLAAQLGERGYSRVKSKIYLTPLAANPRGDSSSGTEFRERHGIGFNEFVYLSTGTVRPYKNVEFVIQLANEMKRDGVRARFIIQGHVPSRQYLSQIKAQAVGLDNLVWIPHYVEDRELFAMLRACDLVLLPYSLDSSLNSGTCMSVFASGRNVVCPNIGTISDLPADLAFSYSYRTSRDHYANFKVAAYKAYSEYCESPERFRGRERGLLREMEQEHSIQKCAERFAVLLKSTS